MEFIQETDDGAQVRLTTNELVLLANALNEICNGLDLPEFTSRVGAERCEAIRLLETIRSALAERFNREMHRQEAISQRRSESK